MKHWRRLLPLFIGTLGLAIASARAAPLSTNVTLTDYLGVDWKDELVHAALNFPPGAMPGAATARVTREDGKEIPAQVSDVERYDDGSVRSMKVWFFSDLPANSSASHTIQPGAKPAFAKATAGEPAAHAGVVVEQAPDSITLTTKAPKPMGVRLLGGAKTFAWPVPLNDALVPIQALLMPSGRAVGKGRFHAPFRIKSYEARIIHNGPLFVEVEIYYLFDVGYWTFRARVLAGCPMIQIAEEFNTGNSGQKAKQFDRFFDFVLNHGGFQPTQGWYADNSSAPKFSELGKLLVPKSWEALGATAPGGVGLAVNGYPLSFLENRDDYYLAGWPAGQPNIGVAVRFVEPAFAKATAGKPGGEAIGFAALRVDGWRNPLSLRLHTNPKGELLARWPIQKYEQDWSSDGFGERSPNYTGVTLFTPPDTARRSYGIMLSAAEDEKETRLESLAALAAQLASDPLDEVRHWTLDWPDPMAGAKWTNSATAAGSNIVELMRTRLKLTRLGGYFTYWDMGFHFNFNRSVFPGLRAVMDDPSQLTAAQRKELRRLVAYEAYRQNAFAQLPYGAGFHLSNPNKSIMAIEARAQSASLIKDHPMFKPWGATALNLLRAYLARYTFASGAPFENPHYTLGVTLDWAAQANQIILDNGVGDAFDTELFQKSIRFVMNWLTPPDPRFNGHRVVLPLGNGSYQSVPPSFGEQFVRYYQQRDPKLAGELQWFVNQTLPDEQKLRLVADKPPELKSGWWRDYGVIFRHGYGTKHETLMHLLAGKCFGHYELETDQMAYTLYAKGQPIHLSFGNGYFPIFNRPWLRNRVSFDMKFEAPERNRIEVERASFSPEAEYFRAVRETDQLLPCETEYPLLTNNGLAWSDAEGKNHRAMVEQWDAPESFIPMTIWQRQMLFLKDADPQGPNYFVLRDTFNGVATVPTDLSLWFLAKGMTEQSGVYHFDGQCEVDMDVFVATPAPGSFTPHTNKYGHAQQPYRRLVGFDPKYHPDGKLREDQLLLRIRQSAGQGYLVVLYPRLKQGDPEAIFSRLADGVVRVETPRSTDYVFVNSFPSAYKDDRIAFEGMAASVRFYKSGKVVAANSEGPCNIKVGGKTIAGGGAFVVEIVGQDTKIVYRAEEGAVNIQ